ncbi:MAG: aldo/keto reductase [Betaproteobacteria bacterium]
MNMLAIPFTARRRAALKNLAGAGAWLAMSNLDAQPTPTSGARIMRPIPSTGEQLPVIGLGTYQAFDVGTVESERAALKDVLRNFVQMGGTLVDSSPMYGRAEAVVGDLVAELGIRRSLFLATKVWTSGRAAGIAQMETSFKLLQTQTMDLMQIHNLVDAKTHTATLKAWKSQGRVRYIGITHYQEGAYDDLERLIKTRDYDFVQLNYSIAEREAENRVLPLAQQMGVAVIANRPFAKASLFSKVKGKSVPEWANEFDCATWAQFFLKYIVANPALTCAIPATSNPKHLADNMTAGVGKLPDADTRRRMAKLVDEL